jgi:hypothetical protein
MKFKSAWIDNHEGKAQIYCAEGDIGSKNVTCYQLYSGDNDGASVNIRLHWTCGQAKITGRFSSRHWNSSYFFITFEGVVLCSKVRHENNRRTLSVPMAFAHSPPHTWLYAMKASDF